MIVKLLTEHHLEFLSLKGGCRGQLDTCQNATLLEISCTGSINFSFVQINTSFAISEARGYHQETPVVLLDKMLLLEVQKV